MRTKWDWCCAWDSARPWSSTSGILPRCSCQKSATTSRTNDGKLRTRTWSNLKNSRILNGPVAHSSSTGVWKQNIKVNNSICIITTLQGNQDYTGSAARDTANALKTLVGAARGVAANTDELNSQLHLLGTARDVMEKSAQLIEETKKAVQDPENPENQRRIAQVNYQKLLYKDLLFKSEY